MNTPGWEAGGWTALVGGNPTESIGRSRVNNIALTQFLASIRDRLGTAAVKEQALGLCQELFVADGARSDEENTVLQNLRKLLE